MRWTSSSVVVDAETQDKPPGYRNLWVTGRQNENWNKNLRMIILSFRRKLKAVCRVGDGFRLHDFNQELSPPGAGE